MTDQEDQRDAVEPVAALVESITAEEQAWYNWYSRVNAECCKAGLHCSSIENGGGTCTDASFGKDANDAPLRESL